MLTRPGPQKNKVTKAARYIRLSSELSSGLPASAPNTTTSIIIIKGITAILVNNPNTTNKAHNTSTMMAMIKVSFEPIPIKL